MEVINWQQEEEKGSWSRPNLIAWALIEAMAAKSEGSDVKKVFSPFDPKALEVEFKVNGVDVNFKSLCESIQKSIENLENEIRGSLIKDAALELISELENKVHSWEQEN